MRPQWVTNLWPLLEQIEKTEKPGTVDTYYRCRTCGQHWLYRQEFVGHQEVDETLTQVRNDYSNLS